MTQLPLFGARPAPDRSARPDNPAWWSWVLDVAERPSSMGDRVALWNASAAAHIRRRWRWA